MVPFHSCVDCAPPLQISEVSESPRPPQTFIYPPWPDSLLHPGFHFWSMHSSAERASELTLAGRGARNRVFWDGFRCAAAWSQLPLGMLPAERRSRFWKGSRCSSWVCWFAPASWLSQPVLINFAPRAPAPLCWESLGFGGHQHRCVPSRDWERGTRAAPVLSCPSRQQRWFGVFKAKVDFSLRKPTINPAGPPPCLPHSLLAFWFCF